MSAEPKWQQGNLTFLHRPKSPVAASASDYGGLLALDLSETPPRTSDKSTPEHLARGFGVDAPELNATGSPQPDWLITVQLWALRPANLQRCTYECECFHPYRTCKANSSPPDRGCEAAYTFVGADEWGQLHHGLQRLASHKAVQLMLEQHA